MTFPETLERTEPSLSTITAARTPEEILDTLDRFGIEWFISEEGTLSIKYWQVVADKFIPLEQVAIIKQRMPATCVQENELEWLSENLDSLKEEYAGKWIAICKNRVAAFATNLPELLNLTRECDKPFITQIPAGPVVWTFTYDLQKL
jgi:hypothetical protein